MLKNSINKIAVIGCGWLGFPLAKSLIEKGLNVQGSTTSSEKLALLSESGIVPFLIQLGDDATLTPLPKFLAVDLLIINIPPGRGVASGAYLDSLKKLKKEILLSAIQNIIFISSTSVYAENNGTQTEESKQVGDSASAQRMLSAEQLFCEIPGVSTTIIRMAGLIGPKRHPGRFFAGKENIPNGLVPINLIHLDDCIGIIHKVIEDGLWDDVFNASAPSHPEKMKFYNLASQKLYGKSAGFILERNDFKMVSSDKIISKGYQFKHPDLITWLLQDISIK